MIELILLQIIEVQHLLGWKIEGVQFSFAEIRSNGVVQGHTPFLHEFCSAVDFEAPAPSCDISNYWF